MSKPRYLTKSAFKTAHECPTKLSYLKKSDYLSTKQDNDFLRALADGGFQVGELAKIYHPDGIQISTLDYTDALNQTNNLLERPNVTIFEAAFRFENCFIRADIIIKKGNLIDLIEVKAKSCDGKENDQFWTKKQDKINSEWEPYLLDVSFQKWVVSKSNSAFIVTPHLLLADKSKFAETDGINQRFFIISNPGDSNLNIRVAEGTTPETIGKSVLSQIKVEREVDHLLSQKYDEKDFESYVRNLANHYTQDQRIPPKLSRECRTCEYRISENQKLDGRKSGFDQCWSETGKLKPEDFKRPLILDIWRLHYTKKDTLLDSCRFFMDLLTPDEIEPKSKSKKKDSEPEPGLSNSERQWLQVEFARNPNKEPFLDAECLSNALQLKYPFHFIDFETTRAAIPFHKGRRPYEQIAFQFSHHIVHDDGRIEHKNQFLSFERGKFPNYDFVRALKQALGIDGGTIFRYADHENTVLREIHTQLYNDSNPPKDKKELCSWIDSITRNKGPDGEYRTGARCMIDLKMLVQKYYFHPHTKGSNSIKFVLPAILNHSKYLQTKYSQPIYGTKTGIPSLNFTNHAWINPGPDGTLQDPYKTLKPIFSDLIIPEESIYEEDDRITEGGAAMTAYSRMQFTEMSDPERKRVSEALLRYCELDTFAMVLLYEYWNDELEKRGFLLTKSPNRAA